METKSNPQMDPPASNGGAHSPADPTEPEIVPSEGMPTVERFDAKDWDGKLVQAEHEGRYQWAAQLAPNKRVLDAGCGTGYGTKLLAQAGAQHVTAIDISQPVIDEASATAPENVEFVVGDVRELPFEDDSFDLIVSFEVIEHIEDRDRCVAEFQRVLRGGGVLLLSSPNRGVYPAGNEFHVHEYVPQELSDELHKQFKNVRLCRQHPWIASAILDETDFSSDGDPESVSATVSKGHRQQLDSEMFTLAVATNTDQPDLKGKVFLADSFELRWWHDQLRELSKELEASHAREAVLSDQLRKTGARLAEVEQLHASMLLLGGDANSITQELARLKVVEEELEYNRQTMAEIKASPSWRITAPLRSLKNVLKRRKRG